MNAPAAPTISNNEGWFKLSNAAKFHYFRGTTSLCRRWMYLGSGPLQMPGDKVGHPNDCVACLRKLQNFTKPKPVRVL